MTTNNTNIHWWAAVAVTLVLAGCSGMGGVPGKMAAPAPAPARCDAAAAQFAVGQSFGPMLERDVRARSGASIVRWLNPGQAVTMEFNPARLNLTLDGRSRVTKAACG